MKQNLRDMPIGSQKRGRCERDGNGNGGGRERVKKRRGNGGNRSDREQVAATENGEYSVSLYGLWLLYIMALPFPCFIFFMKPLYTNSICCF